ncbi:MAG TPA: alpha/beta fold hydrolase [Candidatus Binataceae bacterium]|nr:alpha/beta fold hydrolase [Candidatus Binataceae bacterium]
MTQRTVNFFSEGTKMEGDLFLPADLKSGAQRPAVVLCHGFTGVRSMILGDYAKVFADAGFIALTFDYRGYGGSEGTRRRLIPLEQIDDIRNAISFVETLPEVDPARIGLWGTSFGGANAPYAAALDARIRAVVGQVGFGDVSAFSSIPGVSANGKNCCARLPKIAGAGRSRVPAHGWTRWTH